MREVAELVEVTGVAVGSGPFDRLRDLSFRAGTGPFDRFRDLAWLSRAPRRT
ncbi:hypothetical protein CHE218_27090 [Microbacterium sp. che218]